MNAYFPEDLNHRRVYWAPELSARGRAGTRAATAPRVPPGAAAIPETAWRRLQAVSVAALEHALLGLALIGSAIPRPAPGTTPALYRRALKRAFDIVASLAGLVLAAPIFVIVPILIKLDSPGPVFYRQVRVGLDRRRGARRVLRTATSGDRRKAERRGPSPGGRPFKVIKFRSMVHNAERNTGPVWAIQNDPRVTRLGNFLRRSRIDEVPQLINVLLGQMSLVGPRPERPEFVSEFRRSIERYAHRHRVKPGITGLAQVENGYDSDLHSVRCKLDYDLAYIREWSPRLDLRILCCTVRIVLTGRGAR